MKKLFYSVYALMAYTIGMGSLLYLAGFLIGAPLPKTIDGGITAPLGGALMTNLALLAAFFVPHSAMARRSFKAWWAGLVPRELERTTYVLFAGLSTFLLVWAWQPMPELLWRIDGTPARVAMVGVYGAAWGMMVLATFNIDHLAFFGLRQVWDAIAARPSHKATFTAKWFYAIVRHPISLCWLGVVWVTPNMSVGHLVFAAVVSIYIAVVTPLEEADLVAELGDDYALYRHRVRAFIPWRRSARRTRARSESAA
jgi:protein-S-isoprenylcysteine O-methyltransferase Ste14